MARRLLHVAEGSQRGYEVALEALGPCVIGASAEHCTVVMADEGVAPRHCALSADARGRVTCTALDEGLWVGRRRLAPGQSMAMPDFLPLRCGQATLLIGPEGSDWSYSARAAVRSPGLLRRAGVVAQRARRARPTAFAILSVASSLLVAGSVWAAVSWLALPSRNALDELARAQRWLIAVAPPGSELQLIGDESRGRLVVTGWVPTERQRADLAAAVARRGDAMLLEAVAVDRLLASIARAAQQQGLRCDASYRGSGRVSCREPVGDAADAERLRAASAQVAGLRDLTLPVAERVMAVVDKALAPPPRSSAAAGARKFSVLMSNKRGNRLIGPGGERLREGDSFDGMTIRTIRLDEVVFERERDRGEVVLYLAQLR